MRPKYKRYSKDITGTIIDWKILAEEMPDGMCLFQTEGYSKYGFGYIAVVGRKENAKKIAGLINTVGRMQIEGEFFEPGPTHTITDSDGELQYTFGVFKGTIDGEDFLQLIPDFEWGH